MKELVGTKFLFDKNIISYEDLVNLLRTSGLYTDFMQKPIKDNLDVHSLFIKPDLEVSYLVKSEQADEYYKNAGYSCVDYKEVTLQEVLDVLGYSVPDKEDQKEKKSKKHKYITLTDHNGCDFTFKKKKINMFSYNNNMNIFEITYSDVSAFMLQGTSPMKLQSMEHAIFFNNPASADGSVRLSGDSRDGANGDIDEEIYVDVTKIPENVNAIAIYVNIFKPAITFSKVQEAKAVVSNQDGKVLARFDMSSQLTDENSLLVGIIKRNGRAWDFIAKGEGYTVIDLNTIVASLNKEGLEA